MVFIPQVRKEGHKGFISFCTNRLSQIHYEIYPQNIAEVCSETYTAQGAIVYNPFSRQKMLSEQAGPVSQHSIS